MKILGIGTDLEIGHVVSIALDKVVVEQGREKKVYSFSEIEKLISINKFASKMDPISNNDSSDVNLNVSENSII